MKQSKESRDESASFPDVSEILPVSKNTLYRILAKRKLTESRQGKNIIQLRINGRVHKVIKIPGFFISEETAEPDFEEMADLNV